MPQSTNTLLPLLAASRHQWPGEARYHLLRACHGAVLESSLSRFAAGPATTPLQLAEWRHELGDHCRIHGEGWQMLQQWRGTLGQPHSLGRCPDEQHVRLYRDGRPRIYNLLLIEATAASATASAHYWLLAFTDAEQGNGYFQLEAGCIRIMIDLAGSHTAAGCQLRLPGLLLLSGSDSSQLLARAASYLPAPPATLKQLTGWCSWYHYYAAIPAAALRENLTQLQQWPGLDYLLIDDGYQRTMGDWLSPATTFDGELAALCHEIRAAGKIPALWLAPLIASPDSQLLAQYPDWFVKDEHGQPLASDRISDGGWRLGPWYMLDGSHPQVCEHLQQLFAVLRHTFGIGLFKLDALLWGALPGGYRHRPQLGDNGSYRAAIAAIRRGAGGAPLLGCNAPLWPSLGLFEAMRVGDDVERSDQRFAALADELQGRMWMQQRLWLADPDCLLLQDAAGQHASAGAYRLHLASSAAIGGAVLSGDRLSLLGAHERQRLALLLQLQQGQQGALSPLDQQRQLGWPAADGSGALVHCHWRSAAHSGDWRLPLPEGRWHYHERLRELQGEAEGELLLKAEALDGAVLQLTPR